MKSILQFWNSGITGKIVLGCGGLVGLLFICGICATIFTFAGSFTRTPTASQPVAQSKATSTAARTEAPRTGMTTQASAAPQPTDTAPPLTATVAPSAVPTLTKPPPTAAKPKPTNPPPTAKPTAASAFRTFGEGQFVVGTDIAPGTYRAKGGPGCHWERLSGFGGTVDEIIAKNNASGPVIVAIGKTDKGFNSKGCGEWTSDLSRITVSTTAPIKDGTFLVKVDIAPGAWRSAGGSPCYWARLRSFGGTADDIIANGNVTNSVIVAITAGDAGFTSSGCGGWTKVL